MRFSKHYSRSINNRFYLQTSLLSNSNSSSSHSQDYWNIIQSDLMIDVLFYFHHHSNYSRFYFRFLYSSSSMSNQHYYININSFFFTIIISRNIYVFLLMATEWSIWLLFRPELTQSLFQERFDFIQAELLLFSIWQIRHKRNPNLFINNVIEQNRNRFGIFFIRYISVYYYIFF